MDTKTGLAAKKRDASAARTLSSVGEESTSEPRLAVMKRAAATASSSPSNEEKEPRLAMIKRAAAAAAAAELSDERRTQHEESQPGSSSSSIPGALAVEGPHFLEQERSESQSRQTSAEQVDAEAYLVDEKDEREKYRKEILGSVAEAEQVEENGNHRCRQFTFGAIIMVFVVALIVVMDALLGGGGNSGNSANSQQDSNTTSLEDEDLLASVFFRTDSSTAFLFQGDAQLRTTGLFDDKNVSSGSFSRIQCRVQPCIDNPDRCRAGGYFEPACLNSTLPCGPECPLPPESCEINDNSDSDCTTPDCYTCHEVEGKDLYVLGNEIVDVDCLHVGNATREENGETYQWAIGCGVLLEGTLPELFIHENSFVCAAMRKGAGYSNDQGGIITYGLPCYYFSIIQCGCAPEGTGLSGYVDLSPCLPEHECPFSCSDQAADARELCRAFPGHIRWFEGSNPFGLNMFQPGAMGEEDYEFGIYIKDGVGDIV